MEHSSRSGTEKRRDHSLLYRLSTHDDRIARTWLLQVTDFYLNEQDLSCRLWYPGQRRAGHLVSQLVVPSTLRHKILTNAYNDVTGGHLGIHKTYEK